MADAHPRLALLWDYDRNRGLTPSDVTAGSGRKVWLRCPDVADHAPWRAPVVRVTTRNAGCPACQRHKARTALAAARRGPSFAQAEPELAAQWDPELNDTPSPPPAMGRWSQTMAWWRCPVAGHAPWQSRVRYRTSGSGCPACTKARQSQRSSTPKPGRSLPQVNPLAAREWVTDLNDGRDPATVAAGSDMRAWWCCRHCQNVWDALVFHRSDGYGCPRCAAQAVA